MFSYGKDTIAVAPGATIYEQIMDRKITISDFSQQIGMDKKETEQLFTGKIKITPEIANKLTKILDIPTTFWLNMETQYRDDLKQIELEQKNNGYNFSEIEN
ncbi:helix-turn-helix transcriptional regulator [Companilactobacillus futsaii]|uniref:helix-turn-helix transcriptional regulator n=1 Tax=Companilactobacillus futsaii TaxID=938155 RepID=UPI00189F1AF6|nr:plasmid maintenance system antidote protein, XRE family [Companilactobacillus futsaii]